MPNYKTKGGGKISTKKSISKIGQKLLGMKNIKKKPVIKKNIGKMLETFSPAYSIMKGKGPISGALAQLGKTGMSPIGSLALDKREEAKKRKMAMAAGRNAGKSGNNRMTPMTGMMAGGPLKRKKSIDGCAMKGKTRAK
tara:strand:+ start:119 stop:535 length:417 start_codon:yes stop_codon:yes gene_type:complete